LGYLSPGYVANLTVFDQALQIVGVIDRGQWLSQTHLSVN